MGNFKIENIPEFEDNGFQELVVNLKQVYASNQDNFAKICFSINKVCSNLKNDYYPAKDEKYYNAQMLLSDFGFEKSVISKFKKSFERFIQCTTYDKFFVKTIFSGFSSSKLFELLLSYLDRQIENKRC